MNNKNNNNNNNSDYISLQDATELCNYSQEYLSLRARQGKLKALKLGRNWVTTKDWLEEYVKKVEEYNNLVNNKKTTKEKILFGQPPRNLPVESTFPIKGLSFRGDLRVGLATALVFVLLISIGFFGKDEFIKSYTSVSPYIERINQDLEEGTQGVLLAAMDLKARQNLFKEYGQWLGQQAKQIAKSPGMAFDGLKIVGQTYSKFDKYLDQKLANARQTGQKYSQWLDLQAQRITQLPTAILDNIARSYLAADRHLDDKLVKAYQALFTPKESEEEPVIVEEEEEMPEFSKEGVVVLPVEEEEAEEQIKKLKESFSDEVVIEPRDELSGIIKPIFRKPSDQEYLYLMVPLKN